MIPIADFYLAKEIGAAIIHFFKRKNGVKKNYYEDNYPVICLIVGGGIDLSGDALIVDRFLIFPNPYPVGV